MPTRRPTRSVSGLLHRLGASGLVLVLAGVALLGIVVAAVVDLRGLAAEPGPPAPQRAAAVDARPEAPTTQYSVRVTVEAETAFVVGITWADGTKVEKRSAGEDVVVTRVLSGPGPYVSVGAQVAGTASISCRVDVDGRKRDSRSETGTYVLALCNA